MEPATPGSTYYSNLRPEVAALLPRRVGRVLEIGCGEGAFAANVFGRDSYWGVEPSPAAALAANVVLDRVLEGTFDDVVEDLPNRHFDVVICNDVIEHMRDHDVFFEAIKDKMAPGGVLLGSIPNIRYLPHLYKYLLQKDWRYVDAGILDRTHLRFFTEKSLKDSFREHGFEVEEFVGLNSGLNGASWKKKLAWLLLMGLLQLFTARRHEDVRYMQFGFRVHCTP